MTHVPSSTSNKRWVFCLPALQANPPHKKLFLEVGLHFQLGVRHEMSSGFRDAPANTFDDVIAGLDPAIHPASQPAGTSRGYRVKSGMRRGRVSDRKHMIHFEAGLQMYGPVLSSRGANMWLC